MAPSSAEHIDKIEQAASVAQRPGTSLTCEVSHRCTKNSQRRRVSIQPDHVRHRLLEAHRPNANDRPSPISPRIEPTLTGPDHYESQAAPESTKCLQRSGRSHARGAKADRLAA